MKPPLKMCHEDVTTAVAAAFRKQIKDLEFTHGKRFSSVDKNGCCSFTLQNKFEGTGSYLIEGKALLCDDESNECIIYQIHGTVNVKPDNDGTPVIEFSQPLSIQKG